MKSPLYKCRKSEGITQGELAKHCCSSGPTISRLERGESCDVSGMLCYLLVQRYVNKGLTLEHLLFPSKFPDFEINPTKGRR